MQTLDRHPEHGDVAKIVHLTAAMLNEYAH
jgi:hypothetical protein